MPRNAQPSAARDQVAPGKNIRMIFPVSGWRGGANEEFIAVGRNNERELWMGTISEKNEAHGLAAEAIRIAADAGALRTRSPL